MFGCGVEATGCDDDVGGVLWGFSGTGYRPLNTCIMVT